MTFRWPFSTTLENESLGAKIWNALIFTERCCNYNAIYSGLDG